MLWAAALAVDVEERAATPALPPCQTRAGRNGPPHDPFCTLPGSKDCDALREDHELAELSSCVYRSGHACRAGWDAVDPATLGLDPAEFSFGSFHAEIFRHPATGRITLVFRGTDNGGDWWDNGVRGVFGTATVQYEQAILLGGQPELALARAGQSGTPGFAGHSLGGGLATAAALSVGADATVFNPSRLANRAMDEQNPPASAAPGSIDVVRVQGEAISLGQTFTPAPGSHTVIARPSGTYDWERIDAHGIGTVIDSIESYLAKHCSP